METTWQDYAVWAVGLAVAVLVVRRLVCVLRGRRRGSCASCASSGCPLHRAERKKKGRRQ